jgi:hypothetical protein
MTGANAKIMPPFIPRPVAMVEVIGAFEILGGLRIDRAVGVVCPADLYMAWSPSRQYCGEPAPLAGTDDPMAGLVCAASLRAALKRFPGRLGGYAL